MGVTNRFKGLGLIDRVPEELWTKVCDIVQEAVIKTIPKKKNAKRENGWLRRPYKQLRKEEEGKPREKRKDTASECSASKNQRRVKKAVLSYQSKEIEENNRMGKTKIYSRKLEIPRLYYMQRWAQ